jgi:2',3'-cyclic-nucleotide 2'-phosphodiesterase (5'-nucleotidase family)
MIITRKVGIWLFSAVVFGALVFTGCPTDTESEPDAGLDWGKVADWDGTDSTTVLGTTPEAISGTDIRYKETPLGNLIADGIVEYARFTSGEKVDFAMLNGQNVQGFASTGIPKGNITLDSLSSGLSDSLFLVTYTEKDIADLINIFVNSTAYETGNPGWKRNCVVLVSSGVSYAVTPDQITSNPPHAINIKVNGAVIDPAGTEKTYRVAVGNFMAGQNATAEGGDATSGGGSNFVSYGSDKKSYHPVTLKEAVARYILAKGNISPVTEGRIIGRVPLKASEAE